MILTDCDLKVCTTAGCPKTQCLRRRRNTRTRNFVETQRSGDMGLFSKREPTAGRVISPKAIAEGWRMNHRDAPPSHFIRLFEKLTRSLTSEGRFMPSQYAIEILEVIARDLESRRL